jgi:predicted glycoside hydrolase/deacetylase ChbG (UPF0249 family)
MSLRFIVNADDFGLTRGVNRAIAELHRAGVLSSATLMATGAAFEDAAAIAHAHPGLGVGCHVVLTDGIAAAPAAMIPSLLAVDVAQPQRLRPKLSQFLRDVLLGRVRAEAIEREALAQIERLQRAGLRVTHLDTHKHTHILPQVARPLLAAAERAGVRAIRNPFEPAWAVTLSPSPLKRRLQVRATASLQKAFLALPQIRSGAIRTTDGTLGISATGDLHRDSLRQLLAAAPDGTWEIVCHPGYNDRDLDAIHTRLRETREIEMKALLSEIPQIFALPQPAGLIHYEGIAAAP